MSPFRRGRSGLYGLARAMGDVQPWLEGDLRKVVRRQVNKAIGRALGRGAFGEGGGQSLLRGGLLWGLKSVFGLGRR